MLWKTVSRKVFVAWGVVERVSNTTYFVLMRIMLTMVIVMTMMIVIIMIDGKKR